MAYSTLMFCGLYSALFSAPPSLMMFQSLAVPWQELVCRPGSSDTEVSGSLEGSYEGTRMAKSASPELRTVAPSLPNWPAW
jgi:hypothetical protein